MSGKSQPIRALAALQRAFNDVTLGPVLAFLSTGVNLRIADVPIARDAALVDVGLDSAISPRATLGVVYFERRTDKVQG